MREFTLVLKTRKTQPHVHGIAPYVTSVHSCVCVCVCVCGCVCVVSWGSYFEHALAWDQRMSDPNVKVITYEELKQVEPLPEVLGKCCMNVFHHQTSVCEGPELRSC